MISLVTFSMKSYGRVVQWHSIRTLGKLLHVHISVCQLSGPVHHQQQSQLSGSGLLTKCQRQTFICIYMRLYFSAGYSYFDVFCWGHFSPRFLKEKTILWLFTHPHVVSLWHTIRYFKESQSSTFKYNEGKLLKLLHFSEIINVLCLETVLQQHMRVLLMQGFQKGVRELMKSCI